MELTRNWKTFGNGVFFLVGGVVMLAAPGLLELTGREFTLGSWVGYVLGGIGVVGGLFTIAEGKNRYRVGLSEQAMSLYVGGINAAVLWSQIAAVSLEQERDARKNAPLWLVLVPAEGVRLTKPAVFDSRTGYKGVQLIDVAELAQGRAAVADALRRYAGARFIELNPTLVV